MTIDVESTPKRHRLSVQMLAGGLIGLIAVATGWDMLGSYRAHDELVTRQMTTLATAAASEIDGNVQAADHLLRDAVTTIDPAHWPDPKAIATLQARLAAFPEIRDMIVVGADGHTIGPVISATGTSPEVLDMSDREYVAYQREHWRQDQLHIAAPVISRALNQDVLPLSRPLHSSTGAFAGLVAVGLNPGYFGGILGALAIGDGGSAALLRRDGLFLARYPDVALFHGLSVADTSVFRDLLPRSPAGVARVSGEIDGNERLVGYRALSNYPLVAVATQPLPTALREWRQRALQGAATILVLSAAVLLLARLVERRGVALEHLAAIIQSSDDAIIGKTLSGVITSWNGGAERLFGYLAKEAIGRPVTMLLPPDRAAEEQDILARIAEGKSVEHFETVRRCKNGKPVHVSATVSPIRDRKGRIVGASKIARDITVRKEAEDEILRLNADLERRVEERTAELRAANHEMESFTYAVSHDLRAPLRAMAGFSLALIEDYGDTIEGEAREYLDQIIVASRHMGALIDGLLHLSRCTRGEVVRDGIDLSAMAELIREELRQAHPDRRVTWRIQPGLSAWGDPRLIEIVMRNLMGNALKYTARTDGAEIRVFGEATDEGARCCVADNGAGFDPAHADKLFRPFQRLHRQEEFPGLGIGLATVQRIMLSHGGGIDARSAPGKGATFCFTVPAESNTAKDLA